MRPALTYIIIILVISCAPPVAKEKEEKPGSDTLINFSMPDSMLTTMEDLPIVTDSSQSLNTAYPIDTKNTEPAEVLAFAHTLIGVPYKYGSIDPTQGFDCSGFITYTFNHFKIDVPRSSVEFTDVGTPVSIEDAKPGDLILFTGTDKTKRVVGHMGIINTNTTEELTFIHSTSGKAYGVTISPLSQHYKERFMKVIRIFPQNI